ncbi:RecQ family ATP-dependent DNA helicase [bacterium]|nr:RecQ family ATP-dependent DNA helicase [bacterium]
MDRLPALLKRFWGYDGFLPLQEDAMRCWVQKQDSLVVLPTGGGKSLCYQAPSLLGEGLTLVVSPLISLMKDQVDGLRACGVAADCLNSSQDQMERNRVERELAQGLLRLLYVAPERLATSRFLDMLRHRSPTGFAIDEAHCISHWGHDFRPDYRNMNVLRHAFPGVPVHAYTATATRQVREDIVQQLDLRGPKLLVGSFDRPNLFYRVARREYGKHGRFEQIRETLSRYRGESCIVYCISRRDVEDLASDLCGAGFHALPYHAGLDDEVRKRHQDDFINERAPIIVATVAFGMGIDKPNVRCVIHAAMPKSIEHYQQEAGRAGRDGLDAECCLFYGGNDYQVWKRLLRRSESDATGAALHKLGEMYGYCESNNCRHRSLVEYFDQEFKRPKCGACDVCGGMRTPRPIIRASRVEAVRRESVPEPREPGIPVEVETGREIGQKILCCVVRIGGRPSASYTASVLKGSVRRAVVERGHDTLSTFGILENEKIRWIRQWIGELVEQAFLERRESSSGVGVTPRGWSLVRGKETPLLTAPEPSRVRTGDQVSGPDAELFEKLRKKRLEVAHIRGIRPYMIFGDRTLRDLALRKPVSEESFLEVNGIGEWKCQEFADHFLPIIRRHRKTAHQKTD